MKNKNARKTAPIMDETISTIGHTVLSVDDPPTPRSLRDQRAKQASEAAHGTLADTRLGLVGPTFPFRGGIAQHTTMLHRELAKKCALVTLSYSRQYPGWLYPGSSDRDPSHVQHSESCVEYIVDSVNPFSWERAVQRFAHAGTVAVIFPWWSVYWVPMYQYMFRRFRALNIRTVLVCHNALDHEAAWWKTVLTRNTLKLGSRFIVHSTIERERLASLIGFRQISVSPHPVYDQFPQCTSSLGRRSRLELLFFGFVRPYKGLDVLLDALALLIDRDIFLTIAGEFWEDPSRTKARIESLGIAHMVEIIPRYVGEFETAQLFDRADVIVLPYVSATTSGVIPLAYHYGRPVIATRVGGIPEVIDQYRTGLLVAPGSSHELADAITYMSGADPIRMRSACTEAAQRYSWSSFAAVVRSEAFRE